MWLMAQAGISSSSEEDLTDISVTCCKAVESPLRGWGLMVHDCSFWEVFIGETMVEEFPWILMLPLSSQMFDLLSEKSHNGFTSDGSVFFLAPACKRVMRKEVF